MGYIMVDDRASGGKLKEFDSTSCRHCQAVIKMVHRAPSGAWCTKCSGPVCDTPKCATLCLPFKQKVDRQIDDINRKLASQRFFRALRVQS